MPIWLSARECQFGVHSGSRLTSHCGSWQPETDHDTERNVATIPGLTFIVERGRDVAEGFAGARSLDERRRRRLAGEAQSVQQAPFPDVSVTDIEPLSSHEVGDASFPIRRLISPRLWKLVAFIAGSVLVTAGLVWFGMSRPIRESVFGDRFSNIFQLPNGSIFTWFSSLLLIGAAQLSFVIGWVRSRNQHDFGGNYRIWRWAAVLFFAGSVFVSTGFHLAVADIVTHFVNARYPYRDVLNWLLPVSLLSLPIVMKVIHDMSNCRFSTALFSTTMVAAFTVAMTPIVERWDTDPSTLAIAQMSVCCLLFCSLLIHAWYVVHVSSEPPGPSIRATRKDSADQPQTLSPPAETIDAGGRAEGLFVPLDPASIAKQPSSHKTVAKLPPASPKTPDPANQHSEATPKPQIQEPGIGRVAAPHSTDVVAKGHGKQRVSKSKKKRRARHR